MKLACISLGCPKNQVDLEQIMGGLSNRIQITADLHEAQAVIINTCAFIHSAKEESIDAIFDVVRLKKEGYPVKILVTGCLPQRFKTQLDEILPEVDAFYDDLDAKKVVLQIQRFLGLPESGCQMRMLLSKSHFAYLKIADGCDNRCSYCAIPLIKGNFQSRPSAEIVAEAAQLVQNGSRELILVAQDVTNYGRDLREAESLATLLTELHNLSDLRWIRLLYTHPAHWTDELIELLAVLPKVCKYVDLPIQHISDRILKRMGRRVSRKDLEVLIKKLRRKIPKCAIRTTAMVGFPGESDKEFQELLDFVKDAEFDRLGVFTYSREEGTPAYHLSDNVGEKVKEERAQHIMETQAEIAMHKNESLVGETIEVLIDEYSEEDRSYVGRTQWDAPEVDNQVLVPEKTEPGIFEMVKITGAETYDLLGTIIGSPKESNVVSPDK